MNDDLVIAGIRLKDEHAVSEACNALVDVMSGDRPCDLRVDFPVALVRSGSLAKRVVKALYQPIGGIVGALSNARSSVGGLFVAPSGVDSTEVILARRYKRVPRSAFGRVSAEGGLTQARSRFLAELVYWTAASNKFGRGEHEAMVAVLGHGYLPLGWVGDSRGGALAVVELEGLAVRELPREWLVGESEFKKLLKVNEAGVARAMDAVVSDIAAQVGLRTCDLTPVNPSGDRVGLMCDLIEQSGAVAEAARLRELVSRGERQEAGGMITIRWPDRRAQWSLGEPYAGAVSGMPEEVLPILAIANGMDARAPQRMVIFHRCLGDTFEFDQSLIHPGDLARPGDPLGWSPHVVIDEGSDYLMFHPWKNDGERPTFHRIDHETAELSDPLPQGCLVTWAQLALAVLEDDA